jgi:hypothetical protein
MDYMYYQYKTGRLDPKPGEMNTSRMQYLRNKRKQAEMTDINCLIQMREMN